MQKISIDPEVLEDFKTLRKLFGYRTTKCSVDASQQIILLSLPNLVISTKL